MKSRYVIALFACGILVYGILVGLLRHADWKDNLRMVKVQFSYARYPEPRSEPVPASVTAADLYFSRHPEYRHELSVQEMRDMFETLKRDKYVKKVFSALAPRFGEPVQDGTKSILMEDIRGVEFSIDRQPKDSNPVKGTITVRSSSDKRAAAIAGEYSKLLRRIVESENWDQIAKATMSYNSDLHKKKKELKAIKERLSRNKIDDAERQKAQKDAERVEGEMKKIEAEWRERSETYRKTMCGVLVFLDGGN